MSKTKMKKLSEEQQKRSWTGKTSFSSTHLASNVGQPDQSFIEVETEEKVTKRIKLTQVTRVSNDHYDFNADDFSNPKETIHDSGYWTVGLTKKVDLIQFFAHSVALSNPGPAHDTAK